MDMIRDIKSVPVFRLLTALVTGILCVKWVSIQAGSLLLILSFLCVAQLGMLFFKIASSPKYSWFCGIIITLFLIVSGLFTARYPSLHNNHANFSRTDYLIAGVISEPVLKNGYSRFEVILYNDSSGEYYGKCLATTAAGDGYIPPRAGECLILKTQPEPVPGPVNPGEFDYASYLEGKNIRYRCFIREGEWATLESPGNRSIKFLGLRLKKKLWSRIESLQYGNKNLGVLYALGLGSKELLAPETREAYAASGAMHVLAVSGLHVGLIWMVLSFLSSWINRLPGGRIIQFMIVAGLIWVYAAVTGLSASVVRSAGMFSLVSLGKLIQKESSVYNSLSVSAFFGLLVNPQWIFDAGFQLSYAAVFSIIFFQPRIVSIIDPGPLLVRKAWEICSVSLAAQLGTLPLTLFYFNRFPPWFILSNLVVIPLITVIMFFFILVILSLAIPFLFAILLKILLYLVGMMTDAVYFIEGLPAGRSDSIHLENFQVFCLCSLIFAIILFIRYRKNHFFIAGMVSCTLFFTLGSSGRYKSLYQSEMVIFSIPGKMMAGIVEGERGIFLHNAEHDSLVARSFSYSCRPYIILSGLRTVQISGLNEVSEKQPGIEKLPGRGNCFFRYRDTSVIILEDPGFYRDMNSEFRLTCDFLIVNGKIPPKWDGGNPLFKTRNLIVTSAVPGYLSFNKSNAGMIECDSVTDIRVIGACKIPFNPLN